MSEKSLNETIELENGRLYRISDSTAPKYKTSKVFYFCIDENLVYEVFFDDFGPLYLAQTHRYIIFFIHFLQNNILLFQLFLNCSFNKK